MSTHDKEEVMLAEVELLIKNFKRTRKISKADVQKLESSRPVSCVEDSTKTASFDTLKDIGLMEKADKSEKEVYKNRDLCLLLEEEEKELPWIIDSRSSTHMIGSEKKFISLQPHEEGSISFGGGTKGHIIGKGQVKLNQKIMIDNVN